MKKKNEKWRAARDSNPLNSRDNNTGLFDVPSTAHTELSKAPSEFSLRQTDGRPFPFVTFWAILVISHINREIQGNVFKSFTMKLRRSSA